MDGDADPDYLAHLSFITEAGISPSELGEYMRSGESDEEDSGSVGMRSSHSGTGSSEEESEDADSSAVESADVVVVEDDGESNERTNGNNGGCSEATPSGNSNEDEGDVDKEVELNREDVDGLICPICFEAWSSGGDHCVCCLPCGHIYGLSCIKKWLQHRGAGKCPQCKKRSSVRSIRILYASRVVAIDEDLRKKVSSLEAKCSSLQKKSDDLSKERVEWQKKEADLRVEVQCLKERTRNLEGLLEATQSRPSGSSVASRSFQGEAILNHVEQECHQRESSNSFRLQKDLQVDGARIFDMDPFSQILIIARRLPGMGTTNVLTKMSLIPSHEKEDIHLPVGFKAVKDLQVSPYDRLVLLASLGKKLSVVSSQSNNTVLTYDLPAAAWSCSWDLSNKNNIYAGLQNGMVVQFDTRQTMRPVQSMAGLTGNPIHTLYSLSVDSTVGCGVNRVLTASSVGLCHWDFGGSEMRPYSIQDSENQGVCISLAYGPFTNDIVASYRPKIEAYIGDSIISQPTLSGSAALSGEGVRGSHVIFKRTQGRYERLGVTCANVSSIRLPKSAIVDGVSRSALFASADEVTSELVLQDLGSLTTIQHLQSRKYPIRDVKYARMSNSGLLCCLAEDSLQLFSANLL